MHTSGEKQQFQHLLLLVEECGFIRDVGNPKGLFLAQIKSKSLKPFFMNIKPTFLSFVSEKGDLFFNLFNNPSRAPTY